MSADRIFPHAQDGKGGPQKMLYLGLYPLIRVYTQETMSFTKDAVLQGFSRKPIPTKFLPQEEQTLADARRATGYSNSELIRRAVRLVAKQNKEAQGFGFLVELTRA